MIVDSLEVYSVSPIIPANGIRYYTVTVGEGKRFLMQFSSMMFHTVGYNTTKCHASRMNLRGGGALL